MVPDPSESKPRRIAVAQLADIGDMVFVTPLLISLRQAFPRAEIAVVGRPAALEVLADHPAVDRFIPYDKRGDDRGAGGLVAAASRVRRVAPRYYFGVTRSARTAVLGLLSGARWRVGFREPGRAWAYTHLVRRPDERPYAERPLALLGPLEILPAETRPRLEVGPERRAAAAARLRAAGWNGEPLLAVAPGSRYPTKRWPLPNYRRLFELLREAGGPRPAIYAGADESDAVGALLDAAPEALDRRGTSVGEMIAEMALASAALAGDSGPIHAAAALGVPSVLLLGPTPRAPLGRVPELTVLSKNLDCQPCSRHGGETCPRGHHLCLADLRPEEVAAAVREVARPPGE
ncbi:MAG: glycosyltransferase family 9 protein [Acidobacteria bacterium]|nr:MAG: glycosyltransferase family 9 protein [Acidobacteriota bacterium]